MRALRTLTALAVAATTAFAATPALAADPTSPPPASPPAAAAQGEAPPPEASNAPPAANRAAVGETTTWVDSAGRTFHRVEDGYNLDQYLGKGNLTFVIKLNDTDYGPVDDDGHPTPGNKLYGKTMLLTLRAWDVDESQGEVDIVRFNGIQTVPNSLSGADNQWATDTFEVPTSSLRLPSEYNPEGANTVSIDVDLYGSGWAVEIDWAELRVDVGNDNVLPVVLPHGITDWGNPDADPPYSGMWEFEEYLYTKIPQLKGRTTALPMTQHGSISENATIIGEQIDTLTEDEPTNKVDVVAHSKGGLDARLYAFLNPGRVRNFVMVATPNRGSDLATYLCGVRFITIDSFLSQFGDCQDQDDGLFQLQPLYVDKFNEVVTDLPTVNYRTIAGRKGHVGSGFLGGFGADSPGDDDGTVAVQSVRWLSRTNPDTRGFHISETPTVELAHMGLIHAERDDAGNRGPSPLSFAMAACLIAPNVLADCPLPSDMDGTETAPDVLRAAVAPEPVAAQMGVGPTGSVAAGATAEFPVDALPRELASIIVLTEGTLDVSIAGTTFEDTDVFGVPAQAATFDGPATLTVHNPTDGALSFETLLALNSTRTLALTSSTEVAAGEPLLVEATMTGHTAGETVTYAVKGPTGVIIAQGDLTEGPAGTWEASVAPPEPGTYSVLVSASGPGARRALNVVSVFGGAQFGGGFDELTSDTDGDGLIDTLSLDIPVTAEKAGDYIVSARVLDSAGRLVTAGGALQHIDGSGTARLDFDGSLIHDAGLAGPWTVKATLADDSLSVRDAQTLGTIAQGDPQSYEHDALTITGFTDEGLDPNSDGLLDTLRISGVAHTDSAGTYAINGKLVATDGTVVGRASTTAQLAAGATTIKLDFNGNDIGASGHDGPYILRDLSVYPASSPDGGITLVDAYRTAAYRSAQFPGGHASDTPPTASFRVTTLDALDVTLDASTSTDDQGIATYTWDLGDGTTATGPLVHHHYATPGIYTATLVVTDSSGQSTTTSLPVTATPPLCQGLPATIIGTGNNIDGTHGDDVIVGTSASERIDGGNGNDIICGGGGNDTLIGSHGNDTLTGGAGDDTIDGGNGTDTIYGGGGNDTLTGSHDDDFIDGGDGDDIIDGGNGNDTLQGGTGNDTISAGHGDDVINGGPGTDTIDAGSGNNTIQDAP